MKQNSKYQFFYKYMLIFVERILETFYGKHSLYNLL